MEIMAKAEQIRNLLKQQKDFTGSDKLIANPVDMNLPVIPPFIGKGEIRLIIIGQDPTVKRVSSRALISCTLNLDKNNAIRSYVNHICSTIGISIQNVYATNVFKYFYTNPPADTMHVLQNHLPENLVLLNEEIARFTSLPVVTLGEPVLRLLTRPNNKVRDYWGYDFKTGKSTGNYTSICVNENKLGRVIYPFPHQPSLRKIFYRDYLDDYLKFMKQSTTFS